MTKDEIIQIAKRKGFDLWATVEQGKKLQFMDKYGINLWVNLADNSFEMAFIVPQSIFELHYPNCSPFGGDHFDTMYQKFKIMVIANWGWQIRKDG